MQTKYRQPTIVALPAWQQRRQLAAQAPFESHTFEFCVFCKNGYRRVVVDLLSSLLWYYTVMIVRLVVVLYYTTVRECVDDPLQ